MATSSRMAGLLLCIVLPACGDADGGGGRSGDPAVRGGTAVVAGYVDIRTMNPFTSITDLNKALERFVLYMPLVMLDSALTPVPWLAASWDTAAVGTDSLALTFRLRDDVRWHDGRPTTAHDVAATFALAMDPRSAYVDAAALALYAPRPELVDSLTIRFRLRRHPDFLEAFFLLPPLPAHVLADAAPGEIARHPLGVQPVGNGPFRFVRRSGQEWVFESNPDFPGELGGPPLLDRLVYRTLPEQGAMVTAILTGRVDVAVSIRPPQVPLLEADGDIRVHRFPLPNWVFLALNTRLPQFAQADVRRAIALAIDRQALVDGIMGGFNETGRATVTPVHWAYDATRRLPHDPDSARALLAAAGWIDRDGDGVREDTAGRQLRFRLKVWQGAGSYRDIAEVLQAQLAQVGVAAQPEVVEFNTFLAQLQGHQTAAGRVRDFDAAVGNWTDNLLRKDDSYLLHSRHADGPRQWTGFNDPHIDALLDSLAVEMDRDRARRLWSAHQQAIVDESPVIVLFYALGINGVRDRLQGVANGDPRGTLGSVRHWWIRSPAAAAGGSASDTAARRR